MSSFITTFNIYPISYTFFIPIRSPNSGALDPIR